MLVLARKTRETIRIGDDISISIVSIRGRVVRVGIEAPAEVRVARGELLATDAAAPAAAESPSSSATDTSPEVGESARHAASAFTASPRPSTEHVNRVISLRQRVQAVKQPAIRSALVCY